MYCSTESSRETGTRCRFPSASGKGRICFTDEIALDAMSIGDYRRTAEAPITASSGRLARSYRDQAWRWAVFSARHRERKRNAACFTLSASIGWRPSQGYSPYSPPSRSALCLEPELDQSADGFRARWVVILGLCPEVQFSQRHRL
jgi:hypothetical protein